MGGTSTANAPPLSDAWKLLGVPQHPTKSQLRRAYKLACLRYHPDKHPAGSERQAAERRFKQVCTLYDALLATAIDDTKHMSESSTASSVATTTPSTSSSSLRTHTPLSTSFSLPVTLDELVTGISRRVSIRGSPVLLSIQKGARPGDRLVINGVEVVLALRPHAYSINGDDVIAIVSYTRLTPVVYLRSLDGDMVGVRVPCGIDVSSNDGYVETMHGRGLPCRVDPTKRGSLIVVLRESVDSNMHSNSTWYSADLAREDTRGEAVIGISRQTMDSRSERLSRDCRARRPSMWESSTSSRKDRWQIIRLFRRPFSRW